MSKTIRENKSKKIHNYETMDMIMNCKNGRARDRKEKRIHEKKKFLKEHENDYDCEESF